MQLREKRDTVLNCNQNLFYNYFPNTTAIIRCYDSGSYAGRPVSLAGRIFFACAFKYLTTTQISELPMCLGTQNNIHSASSSSSCIAIMNDDCINALPHATATPWRRPTKYIFHVPCKKNSALPFWQSIMAKYGQICTDKHTRQTDRRTGYIQRDIHATQKKWKAKLTGLKLDSTWLAFVSSPNLHASDKKSHAGRRTWKPGKTAIGHVTTRKKY